MIAFDKTVMTIAELNAIGIPTCYLYSAAKENQQESGAFRLANGQTAKLYFNTDTLSAYIEKHPFQIHAKQETLFDVESASRNSTDIKNADTKIRAYRHANSKDGTISMQYCAELGNALRDYCETTNQSCLDITTKWLWEKLEEAKANMCKNMTSEQLIERLNSTEGPDRNQVIQEIKLRLAAAEVGE